MGGMNFADTAGHIGDSIVHVIRDASLGDGARPRVGREFLILNINQRLQAEELCKTYLQPNAVADTGKPSTACVKDG